MGEKTDGGKPESPAELESSAPLMGVMGAFIFAAQMLNFPVAGGTSGHLIGGVLAATLLGPYRATLVMTAILIVQCLLFQDGGLTALGANVLNMGVIATMIGYAVFVAVRKAFGGGVRGVSRGAFVASWFSVVLAAAAASLELALSGTAPLGVVLPAMVGWHMLIGIGEGLITAGVVAYLAHVRPDLIEGLGPGKISLEARP
ncbi:MAG: energy-coupling factor ABC transporter permease [Firmicutes bacterium]|nr:energy-coupling factor ABC transporter permease [Bacillota bacterium]